MVLTQSDIAKRFPTLEQDPGTSAFRDNEAAADETIDPEDTADDLAAQGRLDGYRVDFSDPGALFAINASVDLFDNEGSALAFLLRQAEDLRRLEGSEVDEGVVLGEFQATDAPELGTSAVAGLISVSFAGTDFVANFAFVSWVSGPLVANVGVERRCRGL